MQTAAFGGRLKMGIIDYKEIKSLHLDIHSPS
jgi:hypothetical protein